MYIVGLNNHTKLENLSKDEVYSLDKSTILYCSKKYLPMRNGIPLYDIDDYRYISLYVYDLHLPHTSYLKDYIDYPYIYGFNTIEQDDIDICYYLNE